MVINRHSRKYLFILATIIALIFTWIITTQRGQKFVSNEWKSWTETEFSLSMRWDMVGDLQRNYDLLGMSETQVTDLLGPPDTVNGSEHFYHLGMTRKGINSGQLRLIFGNDRVVTDINVWDG